MIKNMKNSKKSQIQTMETVFILFIFFILLVFGFVFYGKFFKGSARIEKRETVQLRAVEIAQRVADLPEIQCTKNNVRIDNCVDMYKLDVAYNIIKDKLHYFDMFGFSTIAVKEVHPTPTNSWPLYNKPPITTISNSSIFIPTIIYDPAVGGYCYIGQGSCSLGLIEVNVYS